MDDVKKSPEDTEALKPADAPASAAAPTEVIEGEAMHDAAMDKAAASPLVKSGSSPLPPEEFDRLTNDIVAALKTVYDPEIPCDIYELGLIYKVEIDDDRNVTVDMTLTAPGCPVAGDMPVWVENAVNTVAGVAGTKVNIVFDPPWDQSRMSEEARFAIGMF